MGAHLFAGGSISTVYIKLCRWTVPTMLGGNQKSDLPFSLMIEVGITRGAMVPNCKKQNFVLVTALTGRGSHLTGGRYGSCLAPSK